jgi:hypothetical protein
MRNEQDFTDEKISEVAVRILPTQKWLIGF